LLIFLNSVSEIGVSGSSTEVSLGKDKRVSSPLPVILHPSKLKELRLTRFIRFFNPSSLVNVFDRFRETRGSSERCGNPLLLISIHPAKLKNLSLVKG
jgi:hypothetical protein